MSAQDFTALGLLSLLVWFVYWLGREIGKHQQQALWRDHMEKCNRYAHAVDDLDKWCGHQSPHARLIARHLRAIGEGLGLNAGTPVGDEACQIGGLREQLKRLDAGDVLKNGAEVNTTTAQQPRGAARELELAARAVVATDDAQSLNQNLIERLRAAPSSQQPAPAGAMQDDGIAARRAKYLRNDTDAGRAYVAQYLRSMGQHYFDDYIQTDLAGDFACALAASLSLSAPQPAPATQQAGEARPVTPYTCPKCHALWLHWPAEQTDFGRDTLTCRSVDHCHYCEKAGVEQLQRLERIPAALHAPQPFPTAQAASSTVLKAIREANMQLVRTGDDVFMLVPYKVATAQAAESVPAVSDLPPLPDPDLRDVGTKPQDVKDFLNGYATEYARLALAARAPAESVGRDAERERICAAIKAEDDYCVTEGDYMLDSNDCIKIVRGEWVRPDFSVAANGGNK